MRARPGDLAQRVRCASTTNCRLSSSALVAVSYAVDTGRWPRLLHFRAGHNHLELPGVPQEKPVAPSQQK